MVFIVLYPILYIDFISLLIFTLFIFILLTFLYFIFVILNNKQFH